MFSSLFDCSVHCSAQCSTLESKRQNWLKKTRSSYLTTRWIASLNSLRLSAICAIKHIPFKSSGDREFHFKNTQLSLFEASIFTEFAIICTNCLELHRTAWVCSNYLGIRTALSFELSRRSQVEHSSEHQLLGLHSAIFEVRKFSISVSINCPNLWLELIWTYRTSEILGLNCEFTTHHKFGNSKELMASKLPEVQVISNHLNIIWVIRKASWWQRLWQKSLLCLLFESLHSKQC